MPKNEQPKRKHLTAEERIAKIEQELAAAKLKLESKDRKRHAELSDKLSKINDRLALLGSEQIEIKRELDEIESRVEITDTSAPVEETVEA